MRSLREAFEAVKVQKPPAAVNLYRDLMGFDFSALDENDFQRVVDLVLRARADCIVANEFEADLRVEYRMVMIELAARMSEAFLARPNEVENSSFFVQFVRSALAISA